MKLEVQCPACKKEFRFTDKGDVKTVSCPHCGDLVSKDLGTVVLEEVVQITKPASPPHLRPGAQEHSTEGRGEQVQRCPNCGKTISINARKCKYCRAWLDEDEEEESYTEYVPCPRCGARRSERVVFTFWGSFYGPALLTHVQCPKCYYKYNGKTGKSNLIPAIIFVLVPLFLILAVIVGLVFFAFTLSNGP
jgi:DNA-directed RNA polymerase subunit RPC12/RpoP